MDDKPIRIQRKRTAGWRMPENTVYVGRPTAFGNPFLVHECREAGFQGTDEEIARRCVGAFHAWVSTKYWRTNWDGEESERAREQILKRLPELRGKNLACFCPLDQACHADVLLELANAPPLSPEKTGGAG